MAPAFAKAVAHLKFQPTVWAWFGQGHQAQTERDFNLPPSFPKHAKVKSHF